MKSQTFQIAIDLMIESKEMMYEVIHNYEEATPKKY